MGSSDSKGEKKRSNMKNNNDEKTKKTKPKIKASNSQIETLKKLFLNSSGGSRYLNFQEYVQVFTHLNPSLIGRDFVSIAENEFLNLDTNFDGFIEYVFHFYRLFFLFYAIC